MAMRATLNAHFYQSDQHSNVSELGPSSRKPSGGLQLASEDAGADSNYFLWVHPLVRLYTASQLLDQVHHGWPMASGLTAASFITCSIGILHRSNRSDVIFWNSARVSLASSCS